MSRATVLAPVIPGMDEAFRDLLSRHRDRLYRFVLRHIGHATDAEDLAQQAFCEAAHHYVEFRGESQLSTWLYGIAMNLVRNHLSRAPHRRHQFDDDCSLDGLPCEHANPEQRLALVQLVRLMERELADLMPEMREVLLLVALDDLSYEDAALRLGVPIGTVRSRVSRARSQLRRRMALAGAALPF